MTRPRILMVTGAYHPETSGASLQCRQLIRTLAGEADFTVLTTTIDSRLSRADRVDGVDVARVYVNPQSVASKASASARMAAVFIRLRARFDIVHLHGFSQKTMLLIALARAFGKHVIIKLTSVGHDDAISIRQRGATAFAFYRRADRFIAVSPAFERAHERCGLPLDRLALVPNGVDLDRFRPSSAAERAAARRALGLPVDDPLVLFVGFFSREKRPDLLYRAWARVAVAGTRATLVLIGPSRSRYYEIDPQMADGIRDDAARRGIADRLVFVEQTTAIESYYRAADVFALPTLREGLPNVLLEAMASGVAPIVTRLEGVTDWIVKDGETGLLVPPNDEEALSLALGNLLGDESRRAVMGAAACRDVAARFSSATTAARTLDSYRELMTCAG